MNIQLLFVFDGPDKPPKQWPTEYSYSESNIRLLKELLDQLGVPRHDAPGEAAAECVRLQDLGIVDATWTDNTDALMFGRGTATLVQFHKKPEGDQFKNSNTVVVASAAGIRERAGLTREWYLMYATLVGCGYTSGLDGFDAPRFFRFAQHGCFQAAANLLAAAVETPLVLSKWRIIVQGIICKTFGEDFEKEGITAPPKSFPDLALLKGCTHPAVSPDDVLLDLPCLRDGWFRSYGPGMLSRYRFLLSHFNTQIHESWVARDLVPIELNHRLRQTTSAAGRTDNRKLGVGTKPGKRRDNTNNGDAPFDSVIIANPLKVLPELLSAFPSEMYRVVGGIRVKIEPPVFRPEEMVLLDCVLRRGLPENDLPRRPQPQPQIQTHSPRPLSWESAAAAKRRPPVPPKNPGHMQRSSSTSSSSGGRTPLTPTPTKSIKPPLPLIPSNSINKRSFKPVSERPQKSGLPPLPPLNTQLPPSFISSSNTNMNTYLSLPLHNIDTSNSPTCIHLHEDLTLPGELDWHIPSNNHLVINSPMPASTSSPMMSALPVSRRANALAGKLGGLGGGADTHYGGGSGGKRQTRPLTPPLLIIKQPDWDHSAVVHLPDLD